MCHHYNEYTSYVSINPFTDLKFSCLPIVDGNSAFESLHSVNGRSVADISERYILPPASVFTGFTQDVCVFIDLHR